MSASPFSQASLEFPVDWHGRILARSDAAGMESEIVRVLRGFGLGSTPSRGRVSGSGTYVSYHVRATFADRETMVAVTEALAALNGVRMVL